MPLPLKNSDLEAFTNHVTHGDDVYLDKYGQTNFMVLPKCMYFYYIGFDAVGLPDIRHYYFDNGSSPIQIADVPTRIEALTRNAVFGDSLPPSHGTNFLNIEWRRKSYIAVVINSPIFDFWEEKGLIFNSKNGGVPNYSFYDADDFEIDVPIPGNGTTRRTAFYCINHMKRDASGEDLRPTDRIFHSFSLIFRVGTLAEPWTYDPGGTNQGPPQ